MGCSKQRIEDKPLNEYASPNNYLNSKKQQEQTFTIDTCSSPPCPCPNVKGNQGTEICITKTNVMLPTGDSIHFPFTLKLIEIYTPKDMIYAQIPTVAAGNILETAGEIRVKAFKGGTELSLRPGQPYLVKMPNASPQNYMHAYYGDSTATSVDWTDGGSVFSDTTSGYYSNSITKLGWLNCDYNRSSTNNHNLTFVSSTDKLTNVAIFIYFPATKTVMQVYNMVSGAIPDGSSVKIIAIGIKSNGDLFKFYKTETITASENIEVTMEAVSDGDLTTLLNGL